MKKELNSESKVLQRIDTAMSDLIDILSIKLKSTKDMAVSTTYLGPFQAMEIYNRTGNIIQTINNLGETT